MSFYPDKKKILTNLLDRNAHISYLSEYFDKYLANLTNNTLNFYIKGVINPKN